MPTDTEYNPLDYGNLTKNVVEELMRRGPFELPLSQVFEGAGVYALFYDGDFEPYAPLRSAAADVPIYVGKAIPSGGRRGGRAARGTRAPLYARIAQHVTSIQMAGNLRLEDFRCRYLVVTPLWITMAERFLIEHYQPIWNICLDGFGNHDPGAGRHQGENTWWDALHPGRLWAARLRQSRDFPLAVQRLQSCLQGLHIHAGPSAHAEDMIDPDEKKGNEPTRQRESAD